MKPPRKVVPSLETADVVPMPAVAELAAREALEPAALAESAAETPADPPEAAGTAGGAPPPFELTPPPADPPAAEDPPAERKRKPGRRSRAALEREVRELRERIGPEKRRPAPAAPAAPPPPPVDPAASTAMARKVLAFIFGAIARERGEHWRLTEAEEAELGGYFGSALLPYIPNLGAALPWVFCGISLVGVVEPRMAEDARRRATPPAAGGAVVGSVPRVPVMAPDPAGVKPAGAPNGGA